MSGRSQKPAKAVPPGYFQSIKERASKRWEQLADPELAGPWHQLFRQVQSPRHILSELLQNADDAGAGEARVSIENGRFVFEHDGEDFIEEHFASLCRFGYSNKRALHTIGFRGIGFKSTFSLGDRVELFTPTLAVAFERERFTEPIWIDGRNPTSGKTRVEVAIANSSMRREVEKNLDEWLKSPVSLLFFKTIRHLQIGKNTVQWQSFGSGPVAMSEWMVLGQRVDNPFLLIRSAEKDFPSDALDEIRNERMIGDGDSGDFPPCRVEIVQGAKGRLYVVLPTGVETPLPFACNAPFIQDPARLKIKEPETSPTNRWLLERIGELAASAMAEWLEQTKINPSNRAGAYGLLPDVDREDRSLEGACAAIVEISFDDTLEDRPILLTEEGKLAATKEAVAIPQPIFDIWPSGQAIAILDAESRPALSQHVSDNDRAKLINWRLLEEFSKADLLDRLRRSHLPKPPTWRQLLNLWSYIAPEVTGWHCRDADRLRIVPVQGKEALHSASEVVRLGESKLLKSDEDWEFLASHLLVLNQNWTRFLAEQRRGKNAKDAGHGNDVDAAFEVLEKIGLSGTSDANSVIERVANDYFKSGRKKLTECVKLAQIAAKLGVTIGDSFLYVCADKNFRSIEKGVLFDENGKLDKLLPEAMQKNLLHPSYTTTFKSCTREEWLQWISSGRSGLQTFPPIEQTPAYLGRGSSIDAELKKRSFSGQIETRYKDPWLRFDDWDFPAGLWAHWERAAKADAEIWAALVEGIIAEKSDYWSQKTSARLVEESSNGKSRTVLHSGLLPGWALRLRELPCLRDTRGSLHEPGDLLRRTPETEALIDVEPFVHGPLDQESTRPLLDLLGVRSAPSGPGRLLDRLRALAKSDNAPVHEVEKWFVLLDQMLDGCSTDDARNITKAFEAEKLILDQDGTWANSSNVFLTGDEEDVPGASVIRASVRDLSLWTRIGVADRPSAELALQWLGTLGSEIALSADDARRVRALLARYPARIWNECGHWVNLLGEWVPVDTLDYTLSMKTLFRWSHLFDWVKRKTADLQHLPVETVQTPPFSTLQALSELVEERLNQPSLPSSLDDSCLWLTSFGTHLRRIELADTAETERVRALAEAIAETSLIRSPKLEVISYLDGMPAGTARLADILWLDRKLFVSPLSKAKLAKRVPEEVGKNLNADIRAALAYAFERSSKEIKDYLEENFTLGPEQQAVAPVDKPPTETEPVDDDMIGQASEDIHEDEEPVEDDDLVSSDTDESAPGTESESQFRESDPSHFGTDAATKSRSGPKPKPSGPSVMKRFALANGFKADGEDRFYHSDGSWIGRNQGASFPWVRHSASGEVLRHYYPKDHCLEREPLQIEADAWGLLDQKPDAYSFILVNPKDQPVEMTGVRLRELRDGGAVTIHPAAYRLVYDLDK